MYHFLKFQKSFFKSQNPFSANLLWQVKFTMILFLVPFLCEIKASVCAEIKEWFLHNLQNGLLTNAHLIFFLIRNALHKVQILSSISLPDA